MGFCFLIPTELFPLICLFFLKRRLKFRHQKHQNELLQKFHRLLINEEKERERKVGLHKSAMEYTFILLAHVLPITCVTITRIRNNISSRHFCAIIQRD